MYKPTAKGYFSGCGGMELGLMQAGINVIQSLDLEAEATTCMKRNSHYFSHAVLNADIKEFKYLFVSEIQSMQSNVAALLKKMKNEKSG